MKKQTSKRYKLVFKLHKELQECISSNSRRVEEIEKNTGLSKTTIYRILKAQKEK